VSISTRFQPRATRRPPGAIDTARQPASDPEVAPPAARPRRARRTLAVGCWLYLVLALGLWATLHVAGDRWWPATLLLFGPRWVALLPLAVLAPTALFLRRKSLRPLLVAAVIVVFPIMGFRLPWRAALATGPGSPGLRVLTLNAHRNKLDPARLAAVIADTRPDVVAVQEWSSRHEPAFADSGPWHVLRDGELCLLSRHPIRKLEDLAATGNWKPQRFSGAAVCYEIATPRGLVPLINLHLASPHLAFDAALQCSPDAPQKVGNNCANRRRQSDQVARAAAGFGSAVILTGDFNTPPDGDVFRTAWDDLADAFDTAGFGLGHTYHSRWTAVRIDHILTGSAFRCRRAWVGPDVGSPHRPLIADLEWTIKPPAP
jgi:endonuclease/exonuclease/phosphatase (EEP) superfamily protein YafD